MGSQSFVTVKPGVVSLLIPIYKRLEYLPGVLQSVARQDYPYIDLIISDNGGLSEKVGPIIEQHYPKPYLLRKTTTTLPVAAHFNDALNDVQGEFFLWLCDDDLISPNFVSELVATMRERPDVAFSVARQEVIDERGQVLRRSSQHVPECLTGREFIHAWTKYGYECYSTVLTRTTDVKEAGGFGQFPFGTAADDALLIRLCFKGSVAFNQRCTFQWRWHETSTGFGMGPQELATDLKAFLTFLDSDPVVVKFAESHPAEWAQMKHTVVTTTWVTYLNRWKTMYRRRLTTTQWVRAAFAMPFIPAYYRSVGAELWTALTQSGFWQ